MKIYEKILKPILWKIDPEKAHHLTLFSQSMLSKMGLKALVKPFFTYKNSGLESRVFGIDFPNPIGLPAGCDKKGTAIKMWEAFGFGFATAGSITYEAQEGNEKPRLFRLKEDSSFQVNFGLNSVGAPKMKKILKGKKMKNPYGISIARTTCIPDENVSDDYLKSFKMLYELPNYFEINISCPNIPDTDYFKRGSFLKDLLTKLQDNNPLNKPLLLKIGVDLSDEELDFIIDHVKLYNIHGIIVSNLLKDSSKITALGPLNKGGLSGALLKKFANDILRKTYEKTEGKIPLIGLGGVFNAEDAYEKIKLGASLVQVYTGMVFHGPSLIKRILKDLSVLLKRDGFEHISQAVGLYHRQ